MSHRRHQPAQLEPMLLRDVPHGNRDEAGEPRLGCERVVVGRIAPALGDVVADGKQMTLPIEQEVHLGGVDKGAGRRDDAG